MQRGILQKKKGNILIRKLIRGKEDTMDIYERAEKLDADYLDMNTGLIYKIQEYNKIKRLFGIDGQIKVVDSTTGELVGYAKKKDEE